VPLAELRAKDLMQYYLDQHRHTDDGKRALQGDGKPVCQAAEQAPDRA